MSEFDIYLKDPIVWKKVAQFYYELSKLPSRVFQKYLTNILRNIQKEPVGVADALKQYEAIILPNNPLAGKALEMELGLQELKDSKFLNTPARELEANLIRERLKLPPQTTIEKLLSKNSFRPKDVKINGKPVDFQIHKFKVTEPNGKIQFLDEKLTYQADGQSKNFKSLTGRNLSKERELIIKEFEQTDLKQFQQMAKSQFLLGASVSGLLNIRLLFEGDTTQFVTEVLKDGSISVMIGGATDILKDTAIGDYAGPLASLGMMTLLNTYTAVNSGDWRRFGKDLGRDGIATGASCLTSYLITWSIGTLVTGPVATAIIVGGTIASAIGTRVALTKWTPLGAPTKHELKKANAFYDAQKAEISNECKKYGLDFDSQNSVSDLINGNIRFKQYDWSMIISDSKKALEFALSGPGREIIILTLKTAKVRSPSGNIYNGLDLLINDARMVEQM
jgi:hypothetical protein